MSNEENSSTKKVLELIGLAHDEIDSYFNIIGRGPVMIGEIALLSRVPEERAVEIAKNLFDKGLVREIPGKTPFYVALPPYAALLNQISQFKNSIMDLQQSTPQTLQLRFKKIEDQTAKLQQIEEYRNYVQEMKTTLPNQIKKQFQKFEKELEQIKKFQNIKKFIVNLREIVPAEIEKEFEKMEGLKEKIKSEISKAFEKQFRIGALKNFAEKIVSRVISNQFSEMTVYFRDKFVQSTQTMLNQVIDQLGSLSDTAGEISTDLGSTFSDIEAGLIGTLEDLDFRISGVYQDIVSGIENLKNLFKKEVLETLQDDIIRKIYKQLEMSEATMREFWERSKKASMLSFKDVWFVRSAEGMMAHINDAISRVKMRLHVIAPKLENVDVIALSKVKKHVNVRISTNFDISDPEDQSKLNHIAQYINIDLRHYPRENIWSINKDFEEVVVCVVSKTETGIIQIAGMGSVLEEHVKLFAGMLEDVWIQSKKFSHGEISFIEKQQWTKEPIKEPIKKPSIAQISQQPVQIPKKPQITQKSVPLPLEPQLKSEIEIMDKKEPELKPVMQQLKTMIQSTPSQIPSREKKEIQPQKTTISADLNESRLGGTDSLSNQFDSIINNLDKITGHEISSLLEKLRDDIVEKKGYSSVLRQINLSSSNLKNTMEKLNQSEIEQLKNKMNFWKSKL